MKIHIKSLLLFPLSFVMLISCGKYEVSKKYSVYLDNSEVDTGTVAIKTNNATAYGTENYSLAVYISIKNTTTNTIPVKFSNLFVVRETNNARYSVSIGYYANDYIESEITKDFHFTSTIPTSLSENYYLSIIFNDINYKVHLYETPDELREDLTISYYVNQKLLNTDSIKKGRQITNIFTYESDDHQHYSTAWKDENDVTYGVGSVVNKNLALYGVIGYDLKFTTTTSDPFSFISGINHVPSDGILVIASEYSSKEICVSNFAIRNNSQIVEIYLPSTIHNIYNGNFEGLVNLKTIHFAGSQVEWNAIPNTSTIPSNVIMVFDSIFVY